MERTVLEGKLLPELQQIAQGLGIGGGAKLRKAGLIDAIVQKTADVSGDGAGTLTRTQGDAESPNGERAVEERRPQPRGDQPTGEERRPQPRGDQPAGDGRDREYRGPREDRGTQERGPGGDRGPGGGRRQRPSREDR